MGLGRGVLVGVGTGVLMGVGVGVGVFVGICVGVGAPLTLGVGVGVAASSYTPGMKVLRLLAIKSIMNGLASVMPVIFAGEFALR